MTLFLFIAFLAIFVITLICFGRDGLSPAVLFVAGFLACSFGALLYTQKWRFEMHLETYFVLLFGVLLFVAASMVTYSILNKKECRTSCNSWLLPVNNSALVVFLLLQCMVIVWSARYMMNEYPSESLMESIRLYDRASKFGEGEAVGYTAPLGQLRGLCSVWGYLACYVFSQAICLKQKRTAVLSALNVMLVCILALEGGGRTGMIGYLFTIVVSYIMVRRKLGYDNRGITVATVGKVLAYSVAIVIVFIGTLRFVGRPLSMDAFDYLVIYVGAEIPNLDCYLSDGWHVDSDIFGYMTFAPTINYIGSKLGIDNWVYAYDLPFQSMNNYSLGNVYTTFYAPIYDFGYFGLLFTMPIMGSLSQFIYSKARSADRLISNTVWIMLYSMLGYALLLSFFSNKFFETFLCARMVITLLYLAACLFVYLNPISMHKPRKATSAVRRGGDSQHAMVL